uniref:Uncharacterized protein n=1 Tax=Salix viminalis TaxID=40686 RepID=A0A6N2L9B4_SALVM
MFITRFLHFYSLRSSCAKAPLVTVQAQLGDAHQVLGREKVSLAREESCWGKRGSAQCSILEYEGKLTMLGRLCSPKCRLERVIALLQAMLGGLVIVIRLPNVEGIRNSTMKEEPLINTFAVEEIRKYSTPGENRAGNSNIYGTEYLTP